MRGLITRDREPRDCVKITAAERLESIGTTRASCKRGRGDVARVKDFTGGLLQAVRKPDSISRMKIVLAVSSGSFLHGLTNEYPSFLTTGFVLELLTSRGIL